MSGPPFGLEIPNGNMSRHRMLKPGKTIVCVGFVFCLMGAAFAEKIKAEHDNTIDFSTYKTYAWGKNVEPVRAAGTMFIKGAIDAQLQARMLQEVDIAHADLVVRYGAASDTDMNFGAASDPSYSYIGGAPVAGATVWSPSFGTSTGGRYVRKGSLLIEIFDTKQKRLIWTAIASDAIHDSPMKAIEQLNKIVPKMFASYPVKKRS